MDIESLPYRPCVGIMLLNKQGLVFVGKRKDGKEPLSDEYRWQMPQGGIDEGEDALSAAKRELFEETNISSIEFVAEHPEWLSYDLPQEFLGKSWKGKYRGQTQKWFLFRFIGDEAEIDVEHPGGGHKAEFKKWKWVDATEAPSLVVPFKKAVYQTVLDFYLTRFPK